jgi:phosphopantetheine adenylyltransferase
VVVGVVRDPQHKSTLFSVDERVGFLREALSDVGNVQVEVFSDLVVETDEREHPDLPLVVRTSRRYGSSRITLFEAPDGEPAVA